MKSEKLTNEENLKKEEKKTTSGYISACAVFFKNLKLRRGCRKYKNGKNLPN